MKLTGFRNQCPTCHEYFNSNFAFDKHRIGNHRDLNRRCMNPEEMLGKGMGLNVYGFWVGNKMEDSLVEKLGGS
jgi:hypothetical protein